ncbi:uncharacterized protein LOC128851150 [Cuculus canorus]|uniref:uncharacterized protein LOC128851150 n=1 Tax=Cuculus canorus TaxID=55661 RepID=UPI0023AB3D5D|nr:uncharacterized protein LOC128851150 [Cuculus canorus]
MPCAAWRRLRTEPEWEQDRAPAAGPASNPAVSGARRGSLAGRDALPGTPSRQRLSTAGRQRSRPSRFPALTARLPWLPCIPLRFSSIGMLVFLLPGMLPVPPGCACPARGRWPRRERYASASTMDSAGSGLGPARLPPGPAAPLFRRRRGSEEQRLPPAGGTWPLPSPPPPDVSSTGLASPVPRPRMHMPPAPVALPPLSAAPPFPAHPAPRSYAAALRLSLPPGPAHGARAAAPLPLRYRSVPRSRAAPLCLLPVQLPHAPLRASTLPLRTWLCCSAPSSPQSPPPAHQRRVWLFGAAAQTLLRCPPRAAPLPRSPHSSASREAPQEEEPLPSGHS